MLCGIKPLYYYSNNECFIFASEIKAIYATMDNKPEINYDSIDNILRYTFNPGRDTVFSEIKKVLPGEEIIVYGNYGEINAKKYWKLKSNIDYSEMAEIEQKNKIENFRKLLSKVMQENIRSDVQGGFFLSGGLDSSLITAIALQNKESNYRVPISIKFLPNSVDDEKYVKILENYFNKKVEWVYITPEIARNTLEELIKFLDEPLENPTHVGTYLMSKKAKELGLKTVITGDGADELFLGYKRQECWLKSENPRAEYPELNWKIDKPLLDRLYKEDFLERVKDKKYIPEIIGNMKDALMYERGERLPEYHNMRLDRMTMAHGIEAKVPFQDYRIAEYSFSLSVNELMKDTRKGWLKEVATFWLPKEIIYREKSIFPSLPDEWISNDGIKWAKDILLNSDSKINTYLKQKEMQNLIEEHEKQKKKHGKELWALIVLELWLRNLENWN